MAHSSLKRYFRWEFVMSCHLFRDYAKSTKWEPWPGIKQRKKRQLQDQKVTPLIRPPLALTFPFSQIVFPSLNQVSLSADRSRQRCCCSFWSVLLFTKKITNGLSVPRRDFFFHPKHIHSPCGCTTLLRTMVEIERAFKGVG